MAIQFPLYKDRLAMSAGVMPLSHAGYGLVTDVDMGGDKSISSMRQTFSGKGSLQAVYAGLGVKLWQNLFLGADVKYLFGKLTHTVHTMPSSTVLSQTYSDYTLRLSDIALDFGLQYRIGLSEKTGDNLLLGVTYSPEMKLNPTLLYSENKNYGSNDRPQMSTEKETASTSTPHKVGVGLSWNRPGNIVVAADFSADLWSRVPNIFVQDMLTLKNRYHGALGIELQPDRYSRKFSERMHYRMGINYSSGYFESPQLGHSHKVGASFGIGLPISSITTDRTSHIHITIGYNRSFPAVNKELSQDILKFSLGFTFNETWFRKLKIY